jgi:SAM-dependent methyltransferase
VSTSLIYRSPAIYELVMLALYRGGYRARLRIVAEFVPVGASVLELCPGPGTLYRRHLRRRAAEYTGVDVNEHFLDRLRRQGAGVLKLDLTADSVELPPADVVIMQASLYHFLPRAETIVDRMLAAARRRVIIAEPIRNLADSGLPLVARLGRRATDPGTGGDHAHRLDEPALDRLMAPYAAQTVAAVTIPGGREKVYVLDPPATPALR